LANISSIADDASLNAPDRQAHTPERKKLERKKAGRRNAGPAFDCALASV
jgi:hypothetical protein